MATMIIEGERTKAASGKTYEVRNPATGEVVDEVKGTHPGAFACMLGGSEGRTLLLCCAPDYFAANRRQAREAVLLTTKVAVPHAGLP